jgi:BirA family biotin operon repressor/biotin-[acetyl-CoA-carboxylase] ligase
LREETGVAAELGHPNDVLVGGRKVAGILPEASVGRVILGIGVNVDQTAGELPRESPKPPTSLRLETRREWGRAPLLAAILVELERSYDHWQLLHTSR